MKKLFLGSTAAAALLASSAAFSQYVGLGIGQGRIDINCGGATTCDKTDTGLKLYGGWHFVGPFAAELTYFDWGKAELTAAADSLNTRARGLGLGVAYFIPLAAVQCVVRAGVARNRAETDTVVGGLGSSASFSKTAPYYGTGCAWGFAPDWWLTGEIDFSRARYTATDNADLRLITFGVRHSF